MPETCTGRAQQIDHQDNIASRLAVLRRSTTMLKMSMPVLRGNTGHANRESYRFEVVFIGMAVLKVSTTVLVMQDLEIDKQGLI